MILMARRRLPQVLLHFMHGLYRVDKVSLITIYPGTRYGPDSH